MFQVDAGHRLNLDEIRQNYFVYLKQAADVFEGAILCLRDSCNSKSPLIKAQSIAHNIKGNADMYGFPELGLKAEIVENALITNIPANDLTDVALSEGDKGSILLPLLNLLENIEDICSVASDATDAEFEKSIFALVDLPELEDQPSELSASNLNIKRVVIAYKDPWVSRLLGSLLEPEYVITEYNTESDTLSALNEFKPDLLILDDDLPKKGSFALLENHQLQGVPVFLTFNTEEFEKIASAISLGVAGFSENKLDVLGLAEDARNFLNQPAKRVFIVDDDLAVRELLRYQLESEGLRVDVASDGIEALEYLDKETPDLIILDRYMPRLEGGTVLYEIQNKVNLKSIPVLVLTAMVNRGEAKNWFERGAADFIPKPFDPEEVCMRVKQHLETRRRAF